MRNGHIQSAKTELERLQKQGNTAANSTLPRDRPREQEPRHAPFRAKKKATPETDAAATKGVRILLKQFLFLLTPYDGKTLPQSLH